MKNPNQLMQKMARMIAQTLPVEYTCDQVLRVLAEFAKAVLSGKNVAELYPLVQHHLDNCADCREEFEALLRILRAGGATPQISSA